MDQHPVPRNVTGFEFQLIGFMTLKQFFYLLFAAGLALVFWKGPFGILSVPLALGVLLLGVAFAFLPVQERPMEIWLKNFIVSIYSPTEYIWKQERIVPEYLKPARAVAPKKAKPKQDVESLHQDARDKLQQYLQTIKETETHSADKQETSVLTQMTSYINDPSLESVRPATTVSQETTQTKHTDPLALPVGIVAGTVRAHQTPLADILIHVNNTSGETVRMLKTNAAGQFHSQLELGPGTYQFVTEDPNSQYTFKQYSFRIDDQPLHPWLISPVETVN
ncbi:PrgI family protein [Candidatus Roizmanbacteria bacterium]|nr:PrgI family protein [Candidatus Roizmanbacteria bacterium]